MIKTISVQHLLGSAFCILALVPWVNFGTNNLDSQPWPILFGTAFILSCAPVIKAPPQTLLVLWLAAIGIVFSAAASDTIGSFFTIRATMNYIGIFTAYVAFYNYVVRYGFPWRIVVSVNLLWLIMGVGEIFAPGIIEAISPRRTTLDRGVTSLAPEPTFFAIYLFFNSWLTLAAYNFRPSRMIVMLVVVNMLAVVFLAKSTMGVMFIAIAVMAILFYRLFSLRFTGKGVKRGIVGTVLLLVLWILLSRVLEDSRIITIYDYMTATSLREIITWDASINQRLEGVVLSIHGALHHYLWPAGFDTFLITRDAIVESYDGMFWYPTESAKIMSWIGAVIYELGVFGIAALILIARVAYDGKRSSMFSLGLLAIILMSAVPPSFPIVPMLVAFMVFKKNEQIVSGKARSEWLPISATSVSADTFQ